MEKRRRRLLLLLVLLCAAAVACPAGAADAEVMPSLTSPFRVPGFECSSILLSPPC
jgi:ABC-type sugar transport system substrate-binding protein